MRDVVMPMSEPQPVLVGIAQLKQRDADPVAGRGKDAFDLSTPERSRG